MLSNLAFILMYLWCGTLEPISVFYSFSPMESQGRIRDFLIIFSNKLLEGQIFMENGSMAEIENMYEG
jgi:hypothetical protein